MAADKLKLFSLAPHPVKLDNGQTVYLKRISAADRLDWLDYVLTVGEEQTDTRQALKTTAKLLAFTLQGEDGTRCFPSGDADEVLSTLDERIFAVLSKEAWEINPLSSETKAEAKKK